MHTDLLTTQDKQYLQDLIVKTGRCDSSPTKKELLGLLGLSLNDFQYELASYNPASFANELLAKLDETHNRKAIGKFLQILLKDSESEHSRRLLSIKQSLIVQNIHIVTGTKGGIGKTLISLATALTYRNLKKNLVALDLNMTNPDLSRILSSYRFEDSTFSDDDGKRSWYQASLDHNFHIIRPSTPYLIRGGASSFWEDVLRVCNMSSADGSADLLVDTSHHIGNLISNRQDIPSHILKLPDLPDDLKLTWIEMVRSILSNPGRQIYIWMFWTSVNLQRAEIDTITTPISEFANQFDDKVTIVHVLNPSALMLPHMKLAPTKDAYQQRIGILQNEIIELRRNTDLDDELIELSIHNRNEEINHLWQKRDQLLEYSDYDIPGLYELGRTREIVNPIPYKNSVNNIDFINLLASVLADSERYVSLQDALRTVLEKLDSHFGGCPANILPITRLNPNLKGYTEVFARQRPPSLEDLSQKLQDIRQDVQRFLPNFVPFASTVTH